MPDLLSSCLACFTVSNCTACIFSFRLVLFPLPFQFRFVGCIFVPSLFLLPPERFLEFYHFHSTLFVCTICALCCSLSVLPSNRSHSLSREHIVFGRHHDNSLFIPSLIWMSMDDAMTGAFLLPLLWQRSTSTVHIISFSFPCHDIFHY